MSNGQNQKARGNKAVSIDIFTVLGHDLKSPLNAVESYLEIIRGKVLGDQVDPYMTIVENAIARLQLMRELITDVVDWSRLQDPAYSRAIAPLDVSKIVNSALNSCLKKSEVRNITVSAEIEEGITMPAVPREIELMAVHLIDNAIKYNRDQGMVRINLKKEGRQIFLSVADSGIGIAPEDQPMLFNEFMRIKNSSTQDIRGTGLGLAIVKKAVDFYEGTIRVESEPGKGTSFSLVLSCGN